MNVYVGLTDWSWYQYLRDAHMTEVNFWKPSGTTFRAIQEGDLFLFKLKAAQGGRIAGGGFFVSATNYLHRLGMARLRQRERREQLCRTKRHNLAL